MSRTVVVVFAAALGLGGSPVRSDEDSTVQWLKDHGAKVGLSGGRATSVDVGDCSKWSEEDFRKLAELAGLRSLSLGAGLTDATLARVAELPALEVLQTNQSGVTDDGLKCLVALKKLKVLKFFHPGKTFSGTGLACLAELPHLESLTVAGSLAFGDAGMAAVAKIPHLKELRSWHAGQTLEGVRCLRELKELRSLTLGQRLAYKPPTTLSDETLDVLSELKSLETLNLSEARLKLEALEKLKGLPLLKSLVLEGIDLPEADVERLRKDLPAKVQWTKPSDAYMKRISQLFGP